MEECIHRKLGFSTWVKVPPIVGKLRTCWQCGAVKAGSNTVTLAGNYIDMTRASAPANPSSGINRLYALDTSLGLTLRDNAGNITDLTVGDGKFVFAGSDTSGANTDSTSADTVLATVSSLNIAATTPFYIFGNWYIEKSGNGMGQLGIMLNSTQVIDGHGESKMSNPYASTNTSGAFWCYVGPRVSNYLRGLGGDIEAGDGYQAGIYDLSGGSDMPTAAITDVKVTGICSNDDVDLLAVDEVFVYTLGTD